MEKRLGTLSHGPRQDGGLQQPPFDAAEAGHLPTAPSAGAFTDRSEGKTPAEELKCFLEEHSLQFSFLPNGIQIT